MRSVDCNGQKGIISDKLHNYYIIFGLLLGLLAFTSAYYMANNRFSANAFFKNCFCWYITLVRFVLEKKQLPQDKIDLIQSQYLNICRHN